MTRTTIDFGIDLGATHSSIAVYDGLEVHVIRNSANSDLTPSAVWMDKEDRLFVGATAYKRLQVDPGNGFAEFKLQMGIDAVYKFQKSGRTMHPEELSAEVLKSLMSDAARSKGERVEAAVITVPAAFELPQTQATSKAAQLAGLKQFVLLQEPVAAAMAYGFQSKGDDSQWLICNFGRGTFEAAVVSQWDGVARVVNHSGDNHLGSQLIDWEIITQLLVPALMKECKLTDFRRSNPKWVSAFAKLKHCAEEAKNLASKDETAPILIDFLCNDDKGEPVSFEYLLERCDVERLMEPFMLRSIDLCRRLLAEKQIWPANIEKIVLVGDPTHALYLQRRLADPKEGLGITLDFSIDPLTVLARGAAGYASTLQLSGDTPQRYARVFQIDLDYKSVGIDREPVLGGRVMAQGDDLAGYAIEFVNAGSMPPWRSGKIALASNGTFKANLWAEAGRENVYNIELRDNRGSLRKTCPDRLTYRIGMPMTGSSMTHTVGIALPNNEMRVLIEKGTPLPARKRLVMITETDVKCGDDVDLIKLPLVEGDNLRRADRNMLIGTLTIHASEIRRDIPAGSEIEVTIEIDQSRLIRARAYVPWIDEEFEVVFDVKNVTRTPAQLKEGMEREKTRLENVRKKAKTVIDAKAQEALRRIDGERMVEDVDAALAAARDDSDATDKCFRRLLDLQQAIDDVEDALEWPELVHEAEEQLRDASKVIQKCRNSTDRELVLSLENEIRETIKNHDPDRLRLRLREYSGFLTKLLEQQAGTATAPLETSSGVEEQAPGTTNNSAYPVRESSDTSVSDIEGRRMATSTTPATVGSTSSEILLAAARPDLFRKNAFRVTGLTVEATSGDVARQSEKLRMAEKYGGGNRLPSALPLMPPPDADQIREAVDRLRDPERRLVDEFFWFWPHELGGSQSDEALSALRRSEEEQAAKIWRHQGNTASISNVSLHNLAVLMHAQVLDMEFQKDSGSALDQKKRTELWDSAFKIWKVLLDDEGFWSRLTARIRDLDDPRLTTGTARRIRNSLPLALLLINAQLVVRAAEAGKADEAKRHLGLMKGSGFGDAAVLEALLMTVAPIRDRIKTHCKAADKETDVHPEHGDRVTEQLLAQVTPLLAVMDMVLPAGNSARDGAHDEVANMGKICMVAFGNKTDNWKRTVPLLEAVQPFAVGPAIRTQIEENLRIVRKNRELNMCFFCRDNDAKESCAIEKKMFGEVTRTRIYNTIRTNYRTRTIKVPRCQSCASAQSKSAGWTAAAIVTSILTGIISCAVASNFPDGEPMNILMLFGFSIGGSVLGGILSKRYFRKNIPAAGHANQYEDIKDLQKRGWQFGAQPQS